MPSAVLDAAGSTSMRRLTVHSQYNSRAFGFFVLNNLVPIVLNLHRPGPSVQQAIVVFGPHTRERSPYHDLGWREVCCQKVFQFNIRHYVKCYLPASDQQDYSYNLCRICGASIVDATGHTIQTIASRSYRPDIYVWRPRRVLQDQTTRHNFARPGEAV
jgi:hypothetical protein